MIPQFLKFDGSGSCWSGWDQGITSVLRSFSVVESSCLVCCCVLVCVQTDLGPCPLVCLAPDWSGGVQGMHFRELMLPWCLDWLVLFSALWSIFKQAQGACTLDVSLRSVCSGLELARSVLQVNFFFWVAWPGCGCLLFEVTFSAKKGCEDLRQLASSRIGRSLCQCSVCRTWRDC